MPIKLTQILQIVVLKRIPQFHTHFPVYELDYELLFLINQFHQR